METPDEFVGSTDQIHMVLKGRRTKRLRLHSFTCGGAAAASSTSSSGGGGGEEEFASSSSHTVVSGEVTDQQEISTEEEEDMANCLILLAQGDGRRRPVGEDGGKLEGISGKRFSDMAVAATGQGKAGFYVYECKTCNRGFPSFQALGGHRASHKKPKAAAGDERTKKQPAREDAEEANVNKIIGQVQIGNRAANWQGSKGKVHECSICGLEFTSGQALGGHMRRHRAVAGTQGVGSGEMKHRNILELDLNLPAPEEEIREGKFQFTATPQTIVFSAPTLVDCHY